jgi:hypothetical protein
MTHVHVDGYQARIGTTPIVSTDDRTAFVRYGFDDAADEPTQLPRLHHVRDPVPGNAKTVSPIYLLTEEQVARHESVENPYAVKGTSTIATELQDECEQDDRVIYPLYIESDAYPEVELETSIDQMSRFLRDELGRSTDECTFYYSGNRSIHVHVPMVITSGDTLDEFRKRVREYCETTGAEFDWMIYSRKRQFRLPGVPHERTDLTKVEVRPDWEHDEIFQEASQTRPNRPETYFDHLLDVFSSKNPTGHRYFGKSRLPEFLQRLGSSDLVFRFRDDTPLIERPEPPERLDEKKRWYQYNSHPFSPYANADQGGRSVAILRVKGGAFARRNVTGGGSSRPAYALVPAYFYGACSCDQEFTKNDVHAPLQLSQQDYEKWDFEDGDDVLLIGGRSRNSRIVRIEQEVAEEAGALLGYDAVPPRMVLQDLEERAYDVGEIETGSSRSMSTDDRSDLPTAPETGASEAAEIQRRAEENGIETLTHQQRGRIAARLLKYGWNEAWDWFREQYGSEFKPDVTHRNFRSIIDAYPEDYSHIDIPD